MLAGPKKVVEAVAPVYVESLRLKDFGCFESIKLDFNRVSTLDGRWTCIAGINGSGKSTILRALGVALLGNPLALELGGERLNRMCRLDDRLKRRRSEIQVQLKEGDSDESHKLNLFIDGGRIVSKSESVGPPASDWDRIRPVVIAGYGATRNLSSRIDSGGENLSLDVRRQITLFDPLSQLAGAEVLVGRQAPNWAFVELFRKVVQQVFDTDLQVALSSPPSGIDFIVSKKDYVEAIDLPDGFRSAAAWIADLCSIWCEKAQSLAEGANPADIFGIVLIDEIDLHLHPSLQRALVPRLRKVFPKVQWIVTTHSPLVLANFDVNEIIALDRDRDGNVRELDRQILGFTSDEIYEWLMGTRPIGAEIEEEVRKSDEGVGKDQEELAGLMRVSPDANGEAAQKQVSEFKEILKSLKR
jgi:energy-coupling factor transporter ATP-binding protein EcfA2